MVYFFTLAWILYSAYIFDVCKRSVRKNMTYILIGVWLTLISALQYRMGADIVAYMGEYGFYDNDFSWSYISHFITRRPGWVLLNQLCYLISDDFVLLKSVIAAFVNFAVFRFIWKHSNYPFISIFLYFIIIYFALSFNILRQSISFAIFLLSYEFLNGRKLIPYFICCIIALLFHTSAIILFFFPLAKYINLPRGRFMFFCSISIILILIVGLNPGSVKSILTDIIYFVGDEKMNEQTNSMAAEDTSGVYNIFGLIKYIIFYLFYWYVYTSSTTKTLRSDKLLNGLFVVFFVLYVFNVALPILYRVCYYLQIVYVVYASEFIGRHSFSHNTRLVYKKSNSFVITILIFILVHVVPVVTTKIMYVQYFPYCSIFDKSINPEREKLFGDKERGGYIF